MVRSGVRVALLEGTARRLVCLGCGWGVVSHMGRDRKYGQWYRVPGHVEL